jgi:hypothetical protein
MIEFRLGRLGNAALPRFWHTEFVHHSRGCSIHGTDGMDILGQVMGHTENVAHFCTQFSKIIPLALGLLEADI